MSSAASQDSVEIMPGDIVSPGTNPLAARQSTANGVARKLGTLPSAFSNTPDPLALLRAFQRRIHLALGLGLVLALMVGPLAWFLVPSPRFTARCLILVPSQTPRILESVVESQSFGGDDYRRFQKTQITQLLSSTVLNIALNNLSELIEQNGKESRKLPALNQFVTFKGDPDLLDFLKRELQVGFNDGSEIMELSLSGENPDELIAIIKAVEMAYMNEVALKDHQKKSQRQIQLTAIKDQKEKELKEKRLRAKSLAESVGSDDRETLIIKQKIQLEQISEFEKQLADCRNLRRRLEAEMDVRNRYPELATKSQSAVAMSSDFEIESYIDQMEPVIQLKEQLEELQVELRECYSKIQSIARKPENDPTAKVLSKKVAQVESDLIRKRRDLRPKAEGELRRKISSEQRAELDQLLFTLETTKALEAQLQADRDHLSHDSKKLNIETIDLGTVQEEMQQTKLKYLQVSSEVEKLGIEMQAPERVQVIEDARVPKIKDYKKRYMTIATATIGAFVLGLSLVTLLEFMNRKLTSDQEVVQILGLHIVGSLPLIPDRKKRNTRLEITEDSEWYRTMLESIDSTRTMIVHAARSGDFRVMMVTSAMAGEGKTFLACQLATSLARVGIRTILIDADLRNPSIDKIFDIPHGPGVSEILSGEMSLDQAVIRSSQADLALLPAGKCSAASIRGLTQGNLQAVLAKLKMQYEFIILDSAPVLPVAETLAIASQVDRVILSVLRDVSRIPRVFSAYQRLGVLGVRILGVVVAGVPCGFYGKDIHYPYSQQRIDKKASV